jgi:hypothetical protein
MAAAYVLADFSESVLLAIVQCAEVTMAPPEGAPFFR